MSAMELDGDVSTVLATLRLEVESSDLINIIYQLEDFYERKLWHQLTLTLDEFYALPDSKQHDLRTKIYNSFISTFQQRLNPIKVVDFLLLSFNQNDKRDQEETLNQLIQLKSEFVKQLTPTLKKNSTTEEELNDLLENEESIIYINLQISRFYLLLNDKVKSEEILDKLSDKFENLTSNSQLSPKINAAFYLSKCQLYKINDNYNSYYSNGLLYLSAIESSQNSLSDEEKESLCYDLCISALLGDKIYNFGELLLHDILNSIKQESSSYFWLFNTIQTLNAGNLNEFNHWLNIGVKKSPFLVQYRNFLKQKIIITSLLELISLKSTTNKRLSFSEISEFTGTAINDVELLIIKCFSLNLIKGHINQIDEILVVTWLQPRILNLDQVKSLYTHLVDWDNKVEQLGKEVHTSGGTVWAGL